MKPFLLLTVCAVAACSQVGPNFVAPSTGVDAQTTLPSAKGPSVKTAKQSVPSWWSEVRDPHLGKLVNLAFETNADLRIADANLRAARALLGETKAAQGPSAILDASTERSRIATPTGAGSRNSTAGPTNVSATLTWELDLFGRVARQLEARRANEQVAVALRADILRLVAADIALAYVDLREAQQRRAVAMRNLENQRETVRITSALVDAGRGTEIDTVRVRAALLSTQATLPTFRAAERAALNRLTTLIGRNPGTLDQELAPRGALPRLPQVVTVNSAQNLLRQRPDIRAAESALREATAEIGVNTADLFPSIQLSGRVGASSGRPSDLSSSGASFFGLGPSVSLALFDRNAIHQRVAQAKAAADADLARYQQTIITALSEADTALAAFVREKERLFLLQKSVDASRRATELARIQFESGSEPLLTVLDAERSLLTAEDETVVSQASEARALILVYRAFGGGGSIVP
ncbi:efflux transporter outer membrane subunit [Nereida sp. MMG024]|nr:efflux transporter outer membrane subunit [Nereida sp. MMG025]MCF6446030.1 efflux transporter outer membrane subunit [Nereida sp. MMG025]